MSGGCVVPAEVAGVLLFGNSTARTANVLRPFSEGGVKIGKSSGDKGQINIVLSKKLEDRSAAV